MGGDQPYLATGPVDLLESCDVVLKLDDGTELPVHSQVLARCMSVFSGMVAGGGPLSKASAENVVSVPFSECSAEEATRFLSAIYSFKAFEYIDNRSALSIARLSHKYGVEDMVKLCDDALGESAGINSKTPEKFPADLKEQKPEDFLNIMKCATLFGMPKLLACCEYTLALTALAGTHADLGARCESEQVLVSSWNRIAKGFCRALQSATGPTASKRGESELCNCECCLQHRGDPFLLSLGSQARSCTCSGPVYHTLCDTSKTAGSFLPTPKEV